MKCVSVCDTFKDCVKIYRTQTEKKQPQRSVLNLFLVFMISISVNYVLVENLIPVNLDDNHIFDFKKINEIFIEPIK